MNFGQYCKLAIRTESKNNPKTKQPFNTEERMIHSSMGMVTEVGELLDAYKKHIYYGKELDKVNLEEEIGDVLWYISLWSNITHHGLFSKAPFKVTVMDTPVKLIHGMVEAASAYFAYACGMPFADGSMMGMAVIFYSCKSLTEMESLTPIEIIMERNIAKLSARYPDRFDFEKAVNRDLETERLILEGK